MTKRFHARPLVGETYRHIGVRQETYTVARVREKSVDLKDEKDGIQTWFIGPFMDLVNAGVIELTEGKNRGSFA